MKIRDLFKMCRDNLSRRKARTVLSVLGVVVGSCSILIMVSIGVGMTESQTAWMEEMGDLSGITVYQNYEGGGGNKLKLDDSAVKSIKALDHISMITPHFEASYSATAGRNGRYNFYTSLIGIDAEAMPDIGYELLEGRLPEKAGEVLIGQYAEYQLYDSKRPDGSNSIDYYSYDADNLPDPYVKLVGEKITVITKDANNKTYTQSFTVVGKVKSDYGKGSETDGGVIFRLSDLLAFDRAAKKFAGEKTQKVTYSQINVRVDDINNVSGVVEQITSLGYQAESMESMRESTQKEMAKIQLMLGGIGAVSLLVAAIGIANTMIMSVSERTKEIGVMKALGCFVSDIRKMFLLEAGCIGLLGGIVGSVLSYMVSCIINIVTGVSGGAEGIKAMLFEPGTRISIIPVWLLLFGLAFSVLIGVVSGTYPAKKAVRISALEAMRNE